MSAEEHEIPEEIIRPLADRLMELTKDMDLQAEVIRALRQGKCVLIQRTGKRVEAWTTTDRP